MDETTLGSFAFVVTSIRFFPSPRVQQSHPLLNASKASDEGVRSPSSKDPTAKTSFCTPAGCAAIVRKTARWAANQDDEAAPTRRTSRSLSHPSVDSLLTRSTGNHHHLPKRVLLPQRNPSVTEKMAGGVLRAATRSLRGVRDDGRPIVERAEPEGVGPNNWTEDARRMATSRNPVPQPD